MRLAFKVIFPRLWSVTYISINTITAITAEKINQKEYSVNKINSGYGKNTATEITVVHRPFLSPSADCVTLKVRTILPDIL